MHHNPFHASNEPSQSAEMLSDTVSAGQTSLNNDKKVNANSHQGAARFDESSTLSDLKKLQDPKRFRKARFGARLYKP